MRVLSSQSREYCMNGSWACCSCCSERSGRARAKVHSKCGTHMSMFNVCTPRGAPRVAFAVCLYTPAKSRNRFTIILLPVHFSFHRRARGTLSGDLSCRARPGYHHGAFASSSHARTLFVLFVRRRRFTRAFHRVDDVSRARCALTWRARSFSTLMHCTPPYVCVCNRHFALFHCTVLHVRRGALLFVNNLIWSCGHTRLTHTRARPPARVRLVRNACGVDDTQ